MGDRTVVRPAIYRDPLTGLRVLGDSNPGSKTPTVRVIYLPVEGDVELVIVRDWWANMALTIGAEYIEHVGAAALYPLATNEPNQPILVVDDNGLILVPPKPLNPRASVLARQPLHGDALLTTVTPAGNTGPLFDRAYRACGLRSNGERAIEVERCPLEIQARQYARFVAATFEELEARLLELEEKPGAQE